MACDVDSELAFLARDATYDTVKPYSLRFSPPDDLPRHNLKIEKQRIRIHDARGFDPTLDRNGFLLTSLQSKMNYEDFDDEGKIGNVYAKELETHLKGVFGASQVKVIDYAVRRRHPNFPVSTGKEYRDQQPASLVHIGSVNRALRAESIADSYLDFSLDEGIKMLNRLYGDRSDEILQHRWLIINAWRPLRGPLFDWPLAVCDSSTFEPHRDAQVSDAVYPEWAYENILIHYHPNQKWYYFSALQESEIMLFKCVDSDASAQGRKCDAHPWRYKASEAP
ncbi:hypothetical protein BFJ68_g16773 [Fusarium oxysporum]|uniref:Uncharacterized protein n=1 Tax=Fusarium oxysporum TaxID=5507 RepID=A0A420P9G2_FUSOX|nr:hypothetical protein BFJ68_g16773 [Fusarium oxysporum]